MALSSLIGRTISWPRHRETNNSSMLSPAHRFGPLAPLVNLDDLARYFECLAKLFFTVFHLFLVFQTEVSSTPELTDLEISRFQEDLPWFHYTPSREHQGSPSPSLIKVLVFWKTYIRCRWIWTLCWGRLKTMFVVVVLFVWIFVSRWWCMFGYNTLSLYIYVVGDA
jgi:hypothetical protein